MKNVIQKYSIERHWRSLNEETGGMNDVLYKLYTITEAFQIVIGPSAAMTLPYLLYIKVELNHVISSYFL